MMCLREKYFVKALNHNITDGKLITCLPIVKASTDIFSFFWSLLTRDLSRVPLGNISSAPSKR